MPSCSQIIIRLRRGWRWYAPLTAPPTAASTQHLSAEKKAAAVIPLAPPGHPSFSKPYFAAGRLCLSLVAHAGGVRDALLGLRSKFELD